jgi:hypothetical protein
MLVDGFGDVDLLVFVSAGFAEDDVVLDRHGAAIQAAAAATVRHVIYTSLVGAGDQLTTALAHRWAEARFATALFDVTILRNGLHAETPAGIALAAAESAAATGVFRAPLGCGRTSVVAREDLADAAARIAVDVQRSLDTGERSRHAGRTSELAGVTAVGGNEIATALAHALEPPVHYEPGWLRDARAELAASGLAPYQQESQSRAAADHLRRRRSHGALVDRERRVQEAAPQRRRDRDRRGPRSRAPTHNRQPLARGRRYGAGVRQAIRSRRTAMPIGNDVAQRGARRRERSPAPPASRAARLARPGAGTRKRRGVRNGSEALAPGRGRHRAWFRAGRGTAADEAGILDLNVREPFEPRGEIPVSLPEEAHHRRDDDQAHDRRVYQ